jgi:DNA repair protein RecO (recombination protein O)
MNRIVTTGIILTRIDYGEADRILSLLTPEGKLSLLAKGVRRIKSKLAGGIELFSVSEITYIKGRSDLGTLVSSRLIKHYGNIVTDLDRTMLGYELIKQLNKVTEDQTEQEYFELLQQAFEALNEFTIPISLIRFWFAAQLLRLSGHTPNLQSDADNQKLQPNKLYEFDFERMCFFDATPRVGHFSADHIKFLRLAFAGHLPKVLCAVQGSDDLLEPCISLLSTAMRARDY